MPYKTEATNRQADARRKGDMLILHQADRTGYDTPGSITWCACADCNRVRRVQGVREKTWQGLTRTKRT